MRVVIISLLFSVAKEVLLLVIYGILLFPEGNMVYKVLWRRGFCGIGMGATFSTGINRFIFRGEKHA